MKTIVDYQIAFSSSLSELESAVKRLLKSGWQPLGGIAQDYVEGMSRYAQVMVRHEDNPQPGREE